MMWVGRTVAETRTRYYVLPSIGRQLVEKPCKVDLYLTCSATSLPL